VTEFGRKLFCEELWLEMGNRRGVGNIVLRVCGSDAVFTELSYTYPLKLLSPRSCQAFVAICYILNYGGGLVGGDSVDMMVDVGPQARLLLLTQGSTKIFKARKDARPSAPQLPSSFEHEGSSRQNFDVVVASSGIVFILPDPVTCFRSASYTQTQRIMLQRGASAVILDSFTSGRKSRGEEWEFSRYHTVNEVWVEGKRVARDAMLLEDDNGDNTDGILPPRSLKLRLAPYSCYATLLLFGPLIQATITFFIAEYSKISQMYRSSHPDFIWSLSTIEDGLVVRAAGKETEAVQRWLREMLKDLRVLLGDDAYSKAFV